METRNVLLMYKQNLVNTHLHKKYKRYRNNVTGQVKNAQINYQSIELDIVKDDISKSWKFLSKCYKSDFNRDRSGACPGIGKGGGAKI